MSITSRSGLRAVHLIALSVAVFAASCSRTALPEEAEYRERVSFVVEGFVPTRAAVTAGEDRVVSLDVIAFRRDNGLVDASARVEAGAGNDDSVSTITAELTAGVPVDWYVVANAPSGAVSSYSSRQSFLSGTTTLAQGIRSTLVMMGYGSLDGAPSSGMIPVRLSRYGCKVTVESVAVEWEDAFSMGSVSIGRVALVNVVGSTPWSAVPADGGLWYNKGQIASGQPAAVDDMILKDWGGLSVTSSEPVSIVSPLYCMPNPVVNGDNAGNTPSWTPRTTRVSVEVVIGGVSNWYPIDLPAMSCNKHYYVRRLTVNGPGAIQPDGPVERSDIRFTVSVTEWSDEYIDISYGL